MMDYTLELNQSKPCSPEVAFARHLVIPGRKVANVLHLQGWLRLEGNLWMQRVMDTEELCEQGDGKNLSKAGPREGSREVCVSYNGPSENGKEEAFLKTRA